MKYNRSTRVILAFGVLVPWEEGGADLRRWLLRRSGSPLPWKELERGQSCPWGQGQPHLCDSSEIVTVFLQMLLPLLALVCPLRDKRLRPGLKPHPFASGWLDHWHSQCNLTTFRCLCAINLFENKNSQMKLISIGSTFAMGIEISVHPGSDAQKAIPSAWVINPFLG